MAVRIAAILFLISALVPATPTMAAKAKCPRFSVVLEGSKQFIPGYTYSERVELHKISAGDGYNGKWRIARFVQTTTLPRMITPPVSAGGPVSFGFGMGTTCNTVTIGNSIINTCTGGNADLDVVDHRVGFIKTGMWVGRITGSTWKMKFHPASPAEPEITGQIVTNPAQEDVELLVTFPPDNYRNRFDTSTPGVMELELKATVTPAAYTDDITWVIPDLEGSTKTVDPPSGKGANVTVKYVGLPAKNSEFGKHKILAYVEAGTCKASEERTMRVHYPQTAKNNPEGQYPNWFYYYRQTPAARPEGQTIHVEYGGSAFDACISRDVGGVYRPEYAHNTIHICDLSRFGPKLAYLHPLLSTWTTPHFKGWRTARYIDTFGIAVYHEYHHMKIHQTWWQDKTAAQIIAMDQDKTNGQWKRDGVPDQMENSLGLDPTKTQTYLSTTLSNIEYDEEWIIYEKQGLLPLGQWDGHDWAVPGKNWP
jgi:hypothetical protein